VEPQHHPQTRAPEPQGDVRDPNRPRKGEMYLVSGVVTLLAALLMWGAATTRREAARQLGLVSLADLADDRRVPPGAFLSVRARVDVSRLRPLYSARPVNRPDVLLALEGAEKVIVFCPTGHPLNDAIYQHRARPQPAPGAAPLDKPWELSGRIYDRGMAPDPQVEFPADAIVDFARKELGLDDLDGVRVLALGVTPEAVERAARNARRFAIVMSVAAVGLWVLTIALSVRDRRRAAAADRDTGRASRP